MAVAVIWIFSCQQRYAWLYFFLNVAVFQQRLSLTLQEVSPLLGLAAQLTAAPHWEECQAERLAAVSLLVYKQLGQALGFERWVLAFV